VLNSASTIFGGDTGYDQIKKESIPPVLRVEFSYFLKILGWNELGTSEVPVDCSGYGHSLEESRE